MKTPHKTLADTEISDVVAIRVRTFILKKARLEQIATTVRSVLTIVSGIVLILLVTFFDFGEEPTLWELPITPLEFYILLIAGSSLLYGMSQAWFSRQIKRQVEVIDEDGFQTIN